MPYGERRKFREIHTTRNIVICDGRKESHIAKSSLKKSHLQWKIAVVVARITKKKICEGPQKNSSSNGV
jgi:hypothetical protein